MTLVTEIASLTADSYATLAEVDAYLASRPGITTDSWDALDDTEKEFRIKMGALIMDRLKFRGVKATKYQARMFPRILPGSLLNRTGYSTGDVPFDTWADLQEYAAYVGESEPTIPQQVKDAQAEVTFQVVHTHFMTLSPFEQGDVKTSFIGLGKLQVQLGSKFYEVSGDFIERGAISAVGIVKFMLSPWLTNTKGYLV